MCVRSVFGIALVGPPELAGNMLSFILFGPVPSQSASRDLQGRKPPRGAAMLRGTSSFVSVDLRLIVFCRTSGPGIERAAHLSAVRSGNAHLSVGGCLGSTRGIDA